VIDHPTEVALLSMPEQAWRAGATAATMTRLAQRFGLQGCEGLRKLHADAVRERPESYRGRAEELLDRSERKAMPIWCRMSSPRSPSICACWRHPTGAACLSAVADLVSPADHVYRASACGRALRWPTCFITCARCSARTPAFGLRNLVDAAEKRAPK
jgi:DNA-binding MurR/RpiR family transcriptional regulator